MDPIKFGGQGHDRRNKLVNTIDLTIVCFFINLDMLTMTRG